MNSRALFVLHYSPPIHGASKVGDSILNSSIINQELDTRFIKIKSSENIDSIGKFNIKKLLYFFGLFFKVCWSLVFFRPSIIYYTASPFGFAFYRDLAISIPIKIYNFFLKQNLFYHYHAKGINEFVSQSKKNKKLTNFLLKGTNIILISKLMQSELEQVTSYKNIFYLNNGVDNLLTNYDFRSILTERKSNNKINILYLSNLFKEKGYDTVLELAKYFKEAGVKNIEFNFAGGWASTEDKQYFKEYVNTNKLENYVVYHGLVQGEEKKRLFSNATIFVFPSRYKKEVFPLSVLEALSYGLPVLGFNIGAVPEIINGKTGIISNKELIFEDVEKMISEFQSESTFMRCREEYLNNYTVEVFEKNLLNILITN